MLTVRLSLLVVLSFTLKINALLVVLSFTLKINAENIDLNRIFETPKKNYDDLEILERSSFEDEESKPPPQPNNCIKDEPKAIANAQVLLTFPSERSWSKLHHLPIIETRNFIGHDVLCPQSPLNNVYPYSYPPIYPPHPNDPYLPSDLSSPS
ncbi:hypothetical protein QE152_g21615 [Popillia japonica]|uniref:Uncharacterized protein n=1 Tax=Popillia japonica TaxID=7064 RepID=A0AAW1KMX8_POPJA